MHLHRYNRKKMADGLGVLSFAVTLLLLTTCGSGEVPLPQSIGALRLKKVQAGEEARRDGYIGFYVAENGSGQLWLSEHGSNSEAAEAVEKMAGSMTQGKQQSFWHFRQIVIEERTVYFAVGMGQVHYFFQKSAKVIWLAVDPPLAKEAIRDAVKKF